MPSFDEWGLRPVGLMGSRENPVIVVPLLATGAELAPGDGAGEQAATGARGSGAEEHMSCGDSGASSSGAACRISSTTNASGGGSQAPEDDAPGSPFGSRGQGSRSLGRLWWDGARLFAATGNP